VRPAPGGDRAPIGQAEAHRRRDRHGPDGFDGIHPHADRGAQDVIEVPCADEVVRHDVVGDEAEVQALGQRRCPADRLGGRGFELELQGHPGTQPLFGQLRSDEGMVRGHADC
jgi:hypothetical protein